MATNYIVSAQKATVVTHAVVCNFTGPNDLNLVLAKTNRLELMVVTPDGLKSYREVPVFGRIAAVKAFRVKNEVRTLVLYDGLLLFRVSYTAFSSIIEVTFNSNLP